MVAKKQAAAKKPPKPADVAIIVPPDPHGPGEKPVDGSVPLVIHAMASVMGELALVGITKDQKNKDQKFDFRGIDDVYNALCPLMAKYGLVLVPTNINNKERFQTTSRSGGNLYITTMDVGYQMYCCIDGSSIPLELPGEAMDSSDKGSNKAMSAAYKYAVIQAFCIPTEGDNDPDLVTHDVAPQSTAPINQPLLNQPVLPGQQPAQTVSIPAAGAAPSPSLGQPAIPDFTAPQPAPAASPLDLTPEDLLPQGAQESAPEQPQQAAPPPVEQPAQQAPQQAQTAPQVSTETPMQDYNPSVPLGNYTQINTAEDAQFFVEKILEIGRAFHTESRQSLAGYWQVNAQLIDYITQYYPTQYQALQAGFTEIAGFIDDQAAQAVEDQSQEQPSQ